MWLKGLSIDGFGIFSSYEIRDLTQGLTLLYGPNEAGKSTLLAFLRGVLFGFPRAGKNRCQLYPPVGGGRHGGRVFLETSAGSMTVEREVRRTARILLESAGGSLTDLTDVEFQQLIGGVDSQTFQTVFAFTLDELHDLGSLSADQVRARIFAAGVGGAGPSARDVIAQLEKTRGRLLKPRSKEAEINRILDEISDCDRRLAVARASMESYPALVRERDDLGDRIAECETREQDLRSAQTRFERLLRLWPSWVELEEGRKELGRLPMVDEFVPDAMKRLTGSKAALDSCRSSLQRLEAQKELRSGQIQRLNEQAIEGLTEVCPSVERLVASIGTHHEKLREKEAVKVRLGAAEDRLRRQLSDLGPGMDERRLVDIDTSLPRLEEARALRARLGEQASRLGKAAERLESVTDQRLRAEAERDRERDALGLLAPVDVDAQAAQVEDLRLLRAGAAELQAKDAALEARAAALDAMLGVAHTRGSVRPPAWALPAAAALGVVLVAVAVVLGLTGSVVGAAVAGVLAGVCVLGSAGLVTWRAVTTQAHSSEDPLSQERAQSDRLKADVADIEARLDGPARRLGVISVRDRSQLDALESAVATALEKAAAWKEQATIMERVERHLETATTEESVAVANVERLREEESLARADFQKTMLAWGLPGVVSSDGVEELLRGLSVCKESVSRRDDEALRLERLERETAEWQAEVCGVLEALPTSLSDLRDRPGVGVAHGESDLERTLLDLADRCREDREARTRLVDLEESQRELEVEAEGARVALAEAGRGWDELLEAAGVSDEEGFLERLATYETRQRLKQEIEVIERTLVQSVGKGPEADDFRATLASGRLPEWEAEVEETAAAIQTLRLEHSTLVRAHGDVERRLNELERSGDVAALETELEAWRAEFESALEQWRVHSLAAELLRDTLARFTMERQPQVLAEASEMFERVTHGRYVQVRRSADEDDILVVDREGRPKSPDELSRGTAEQLYLCLRLGLAGEFARRAEPIPLVMDDVLVNFDAARRSSTAELLLEYAAGHQVLLFTCHEEIRDLVTTLRPRTRMIELS